MWRYTWSWIVRLSGGPFQYKTLSSTRRITLSGTEGFHINENARVVNILRLLLSKIAGDDGAEITEFVVEGYEASTVTY